MTEQEFKKLLIDTISVDEYEKREEVVSLLKTCGVVFEKTGEFAKGKVWNQRKENIYLSIMPEKLAQLESHSTYIKRMCERIYPVNKEYKLAEVVFKPGIPTDYEEVSKDVLFEDILKRIIEKIRAAKYVIWIAMAWFTNPKLYEELLKKKKEGLTIEIVLDDNEKNRNADFKLDKEFTTYWVKIESLYKNTMHHKFCVIDLRTVIHGTYNWTKTAEYNKETINIDCNGDLAKQYADEFVKLKNIGRLSVASHV